LDITIAVYTADDRNSEFDFTITVIVISPFDVGPAISVGRQWTMQAGQASNCWLNSGGDAMEVTG